MEDITDKIYFKPGNLVILKHRELNSPVMLITEKKIISDGNNISLIGMRCIWFDQMGQLWDYIFSTKDLELYQK